MSEIIILDPSAFEPSREQLEITPWVSVAGVDWGDAAITAYMADQAVGSSPVDYRIPNRTIVLPLILKDIVGTSFATARSYLQMKVGLFQTSGGWILRQINGTNLYADVVNATLHLGGAWLQAYGDADVDAVLTLETLPEFYGDEITLDSASASGVLSGPLLESGVPAQVLGDLPSRVRIVVRDTSGAEMLGLFWGFRGRHYDPAVTAALVYEAETLTGVNGAVPATFAGTSSGHVMQITSLPQGVWVSMLSTTIASGSTPLTHQGTYRVWARVLSTTGSPQFRFLWGQGSLAVPVQNAPVVLPGKGFFYLLDLGTVRIDIPPVGPNQWFGALQSYSPLGGETIDVDVLYLQPLDESAGKLMAGSGIQASSVTVGPLPPGTVANDATGGGTAWVNPANAALGNHTYATATGSSEYLKATGFGFNIPTSATVVGIAANVYRYCFGPAGWAGDGNVYPVKAGTIQTTASNEAGPGGWAASLVDAAYGGPADLWGLSWAPADINNSGFGIAISVAVASSAAAFVDFISMTVYYTLATGFTITPDAVIHGDQIAELRTEGMYRVDPTGTVYGQESNVIGDLPRIPPTGLEDQPVELLVKPSRGDLKLLADQGVGGFTAQVIYRPCYLYAP